MDVVPIEVAASLVLCRLVSFRGDPAHTTGVEVRLPIVIVTVVVGCPISSLVPPHNTCVIPVLLTLLLYILSLLLLLH